MDLSRGMHETCSAPRGDVHAREIHWAQFTHSRPGPDKQVRFPGSLSAMHYKMQVGYRHAPWLDPGLVLACGMDCLSMLLCQLCYHCAACYGAAVEQRVVHICADYVAALGAVGGIIFTGLLTQLALSVIY